MTVKTHRCTCIKPFPFQHQTVRIGEEIELTESQARPLKNGGFITLDAAAGELIRALLREDEEPDIVIDALQDKSSTTEAVSEQANHHTPSNQKTQAVGYEIGD